ncbi:hypothetical protein PDIG_11770 [Penicillium digitatum PHI26]|uniref:Uncharacterized protein n=2 Tax=Penicillium digitatum TaxID=36651 RepID=K9GYH2_PEND2|nr:hypothetical protein PDIP_38000 [Penicillium digitatum Pd1]EKV16066.1 hypothetical protein PDIP_38000 [Penicillium digitatum Pd1]EKV18006.1 hypothetical protein PDIG_11770 [Penicillium digitatum PHI26]
MHIRKLTARGDTVAILLGLDLGARGEPASCIDRLCSGETCRDSQPQVGSHWLYSARESVR